MLSKPELLMSKVSMVIRMRWVTHLVGIRNLAVIVIPNKNSFCKGIWNKPIYASLIKYLFRYPRHLKKYFYLKMRKSNSDYRFRSVDFSSPRYGNKKNNLLHLLIVLWINWEWTLDKIGYLDCFWVRNSQLSKIGDFKFGSQKLLKEKSALIRSRKWSLSSLHFSLMVHSQWNISYYQNPNTVCKMADSVFCTIVQ